MAIHIITLSGASAVGKTSIERVLLRVIPGLSPVLSLTSRASRSSDIPGEYRYITLAEFEAHQKAEEFLWVVQGHGNYYGTLRASVDEVIANNRLAIMVLLPESIKLLLQSVPGCVLPFYVLAPPEAVLRERLVRRGDSPADIERRIADCKKWDDEAYKSGNPYVFVWNDSDNVEDAAQNVAAIINNKLQK